MSVPISTITPGLIILHGNQLEQLRAAVFAWLRLHPLAPLEQALFLVQSNGIAEWLKIAVAEELGVCAATRIDLPGRFLWGVYRAMLGRDQVPSRSALDKAPLTWRLMRLIPELLEQDDFLPLRHFLADGNPERRLQLAERLADLLDQYQVYRADWLNDWAEGRDVLRNASGEVKALLPDQRWQAQLWRAILTDVVNNSDDAADALGRVTVHQRFLEQVASGQLPVSKLPRRVVLFGISAMPQQTLEALAALAKHTQVILAVPNPCQFYWGDIIEGRELLKAQHKRQQARKGLDLSTIPLDQLHAYSHPLLAGWGRMGRDFVRLLDEFDNAKATQENFSSLRIDLFTEEQGSTLLAGLQASVRDMLPLNEHPHPGFNADDRSIVFHVAHSTQREVEILHDQLLSMLAEQKTALRPRDIVVMVPDIEVFSAAIRAVFGQYPQRDARHIPYTIADVKDRSVNPLLLALDYLLRLPQQRCRQSEVRDLLDVAALATRFGVRPEDLPQLSLWIAGAEIRWGLDQSHREGLGLGATGEQNAWIFGIRRMLLGYASGNAESYAGIQPYAEIGGLDASLAGSLAQFIESLIHWRAVLAQSATPELWGQRARALLRAFFVTEGSQLAEADRLTLGQLEDTLQQWLEACRSAGFEESISLSVMREAWLSALDQPSVDHQFVSGGVTFCTLMPMRAVPFKVVCLLGMNDGDYPRRSQHLDFDLLAQAGMARPGDRSRRHDDRYLMLEALLAARDTLYISWVGKNIRDNSEQPASVLVAQLRDYLKAAWDCELEQMTTQHALQAFSRRYFEQAGLTTYAREWRNAHHEITLGQPIAPDATLSGETLAAFEVDKGYRLKLSELARFIKQPAKYFFRQRLGVMFNDEQTLGEDEEPFGLNALEEYARADSLLDDLGKPEAIAEVADTLSKRAAKLGREGVLPVGLIGSQWQNQLVNALTPVRTAWLELCQQYPYPAEKVAINLIIDEIQLDGWLERMHSSTAGQNGEVVSLTQISSKITNKKGELRGEKLIDAWLSQLAAAALGRPVMGFLLARDAIISMQPLAQAEAIETLHTLLACWRAGMDRPLPSACKTGLALAQAGNPQQVYEGGYQLRGEVEEASLARLWPDYAALSSEPDYESCSLTLYGALAAWMQSALGITAIDAYLSTSNDDQDAA
ncbi:exodeoxyribonuclease V subunit gamma [Undibacterium parvum]|uniref:RecBCD enzyme subunit RecC n=1 Tax=Undibacterium parvum TaxID=401471 RepID=A0A3S5HM47_9BURK|nr:exodeoxyribonuclease V subunit gamma [Undibacterium parvum]AZP13957.1 exodeoxyribonuclease V subunit gamma [Undibacterium parvum]